MLEGALIGILDGLLRRKLVLLSLPQLEERLIGMTWAR
jgi:hypothetical protein